MESPPKMSHDSFTFRFPARLWRIINSCSTGAISWGPNGKTVRILRKKFEEEYLTGDAKPFKTAKYESFVRQLNHYGFKKVKKRSAVKKISTPIMHGENKEEAAMLSEYHNPNFTRGQPERVTFLERRSQLHDVTRYRKRNKRGPVTATAKGQESGDSSTIGKKVKKESSVQVSHSQALLAHGAENDHSSSADNNSITKSAALSRKSEKVGGVLTQTVPASAAVSVSTRHLVPPYQSLSALKSLSPAYQQPLSEVRPVGVEEWQMYQHRPYYSREGLDPRCVRPSLPPPFPRHMSPSWQRPFQPSHQGPLYDHYLNTWANRGEPLYTPYGSDSRHMFRSPEPDLYPPLPYPDNRYSPHIPPDAWEAVYRMNRRSIMPVSGGFGDECDSQHFVSQRMRWSHKNAVSSSYQYRLPSPHSSYFSAPDPLSSWPPHNQFSGSETRTGVQSRTTFFTANTHSMHTSNGEMISNSEGRGHDAGGGGQHDTLAQCQGRPDKPCTYSEGGSSHSDSADRHQAAAKQSEESAMPAANHEITRDVSARESALNGMEQPERLAAASSTSKNKAGDGDYSENIHIITDDVADLPLDVAEETVVTCNATGTGPSDHCSPLTQFSSTDDKILMDTPINSNASFPPEDAPASFHLPPEDAAASSRQHYHQATNIHASCSSDVTQSPSFPRHAFAQHGFPNNFNSSQDGPPKPYPAAPTWEYSNPHQPRPHNSHYRQQGDLVHPWPPPASHYVEDTARAASDTVTSSQMLESFAEHHETVTENGYHHSEHVSAPNHTVEHESDYSKPSAEVENGHARARVLVHREERGDLTQLSSTTVQELLSAALRTPGMKIMVDENCHPEKMVLVIPKGKRREVSGCV